MKVEHLFQVMVAEMAYQEILINGLSAFVQKKLNVSSEEIETVVTEYAREKSQGYVMQAKARMEKRLRELSESS